MENASEFISYLKMQHNHLVQKTGDFIFSDDRAYIDANDKIDFQGSITCKAEETKLRTYLRPQVVAGDLTNGKIFLCVLNPGFSAQDDCDEQIIKDALLSQLSQTKPSMFWLEKKYKNTGGGRWWRKKFGQKDPHRSLVKAIVNGYAAEGESKKSIIVSEEDIFLMLSKLVVDLELIPYHSKRRPRNINNLHSVETIRNYVHNDLIPNAKSNNQIVCFLRAINDWRVTSDERNMENVFLNETEGKGNRCITFNVKMSLGKAILDHIRTITKDFSIHPLDIIRQYE